MAQVLPAQHSGDSATAMSHFERQLSEEVEMFLRVAEHIALYRAADGRFDWSTFDTTDAAQVLARADFVAMRLIGHAYDPHRPDPTLNPPWPRQGVVGRVFYTVDVPQSVTDTLTREVWCRSKGACANLSLASSLNPAYGSWPYLWWKRDGDTAIGTPSKAWKVRRITPVNLPVGEYYVKSAVPFHNMAGLVVAFYDDAYKVAPVGVDTPDTRALPFGSFVGIEGNLGTWALARDRMQWSMGGGNDNDIHAFGVEATDFATTVEVHFKDVWDWIMQSGDWSQSVKVRLPADQATYGEFGRAKVFWPTQYFMSLEAVVSTDHWKQCGRCIPYYYEMLRLELRLEGSDGSTVHNGSYTLNPCGGDPFNKCDAGATIGGSGTWTSYPLALTTDQTYTLRAAYSDHARAGFQSFHGCAGGECMWHWRPVESSFFKWYLLYPNITLVK